MAENEFPEQLIKGRIAETVFELMFREKTDNDIYPLGYEHISPILTQYRDQPLTKNKEIIDKVLNNYNDSPDFLLTNDTKSEIYLVEVKYRKNADPKDIMETAQKIKDRWDPVQLFLATPNRFFYQSCTEIIKNNGKIDPLPEWLIPLNTQAYYLELLKKFEK